MNDSPLFRIPDGSEPSFTCTNESLEAIMAGLEPKEGDTILAIGGSGDQAFAMLETGARVVVVDIEPDQIAFIEWRREALAAEDYWTFARRAHIATDHQPEFGVRLVERDDYFKDSERLRRMRENVENLTVLPPADIFDVLKSGVTCTKMYLSNIFGFSVVVPRKQFPLIRDALPVGGLVYISDEPSVWDGQCDHFLPSNMRTNRQRTVEARKFEYGLRGEKAWHPVVYKKVA